MQKHAGALVDRGPRRVDVVNQQQPHSLNGVARRDAEGTVNVRAPFLQAQRALRQRLGLSGQHKGIQANSPLPADFVPQQHGLVESAPAQPPRVQRDRDDEIDIGYLKPRAAGLCHEQTEGLAEGCAPAVFEPMYDPTQRVRPVGIVRITRPAPGHGEQWRL